MLPNGALWDMAQMHSGICEMGLLWELYRILGELSNRGADTIFPNINLTGMYVQKRIII